MASADALTSDSPTVEQAFAKLSISTSLEQPSKTSPRLPTVAGLQEVVESLRELIGANEMLSRHFLLETLHSCEC